MFIDSNGLVTAIEKIQLFITDIRWFWRKMFHWSNCKISF